jgi:hypothetical protein
VLILLSLLLALQPSAPAKTIPGSPGTDGAGGDQPVKAPAAPTPPAPPSANIPLAALAIPAPHPIITEVLYAVPTGPAGDANKDGKREVAGDEFIELVNPHDKPIQLFGYTLTDSQEPGKGQLKFTFPALELPPGGVVVVFNGFNSTFSPPVGDSKTPPTGPSDSFSGAWVFTMKNASGKSALGNSGDHVMLTAPDGTPVQRVWWSETNPTPSAPAAEPAAATPNPAAPPAPTPASLKSKPPLLDDYVPALQRTSVQRDSILASGRFVSHLDNEHTPFSPGLYKITAAPVPPGSAPVPSVSPATPK